MIEFWYEFGSTYSYPAAMRVERLAQSAGVTVAWRPFLLGPLFHEQQGLNDSPFNAFPVADPLQVAPHVVAFHGKGVERAVVQALLVVQQRPQ